MKYIKTYENNEDIINDARIIFIKYWYNCDVNNIEQDVILNCGIRVTKNIKNKELIDIRIYGGPNNKLNRKFLNVVEYIGIGRKMVFSITKNKLKELLNIFKSNQVDEISNLMIDIKNKVEKYKL